MEFQRVRPFAKLACCTLLMFTPFAYADDDDDLFRFFSRATGAQEVPQADTEAIGEITASFDRGLTEVRVQMKFKNINTAILAAHFHCARPGAGGPPAFGIMNPGPLVMIDAHGASATLTNAHAVADCTAAVGRPVNNIAALYFAMRDGLIYFNVHTADHPPGEVRGQMILAD